MKKIKSVSIGGFKNLKYTTIEFQKITALISPNNYGKSNFLQGFDFALEFLTGSEKSRTKMMAWPNSIPLNQDSMNDPFTFEIEFQDTSLSEYQFVKYGFSFIWFRDDETGQKIVDEWLEMRNTESVKYSSFLKRKEGKYRKAKSTTAFRNIVLSKYQLAIDTLSSIDDIEYSPVIEQIKNISFRVCSSLDVQDRYLTMPFEFEGVRSIDSDEDIPELLYGLREANLEQFELFKESILSLFPEFEDFEVTKSEYKIDNKSIRMVFFNDKKYGEQDNQKNPPFKLKNEEYKIFVKKKYINQPINLISLSVGTKRLFWILAVLFSNNSEYSVYGIEELETSIHPSLLKRTLEIIYENMNNVILLITSHSPYLVQYLKLESIYIGKPGGKGSAVFKKIPSSKTKQLVTTAQNMGLSVGEYLFNLMSGDLKSSYILDKYLTK
ncbi:MAG: ATP-binding protein [Sphaerochaetaceae bacterium]|jgi:AAA15 family ATPase/GTPase|nr:ATP-binding protein [Sphaerochaetaceae bacterium]MDY0371499.1 ATP-binding protein [Sphaerochaetaceae bacterium]